MVSTVNPPIPVIIFSTILSYRYCKNKPYPKSRFCRGVPGNGYTITIAHTMTKSCLKNDPFFISIRFQDPYL